MGCYSGCGPSFGINDIDIRNNSNTSNDNHSTLETYQQP